jgi:glucose/arabinose dehydrogenase
MVRPLAGLIITVMAVLGSAVPSLQAAPPSIKLVPVLSGLINPVLVTHARDGSNRLFIVQQNGIVKVLQPGAASPTVFLDISSKVAFGGERGLLGLTFHPRYASNRRFFVNYTRQSDGATVIAEYRTSVGDPNVADPLSETVLLLIAQPFANHNGGMIEFGPDGFLYIGMGDGGSGNDPGNRAQNVDDLLGKMLRIDVDHPAGGRPYSSPSSNPFFGATPGADEIYAVGLRNPFRFSFDRDTGDLYAGDVGQGAREEIDLITLGGNYGWRIWEGTSCTGNDPGLCNPAGFTFPIAEYSHTLGRCAVLGGYAYRGGKSSLPLGSYVYGDLCTGELFVLQGGTSEVALDTTLTISSFGEDEVGEVYVIGLGGTVDRIANTAVVPGLTVSPTLVAPGGSVTATWNDIASPTATDWIGLYTPGAADTSYITWIYVSCFQASGGAAAAGSCAFHIPTTVMPGTYQLRLFASNGYTRLAVSNTLTVSSTGGAGPTLTASPTTVAAGASVTATWSGIASPTATDWIGLYVAGTADTSYLGWIYVSCAQTPGSAAAAGSCAFAVPSGTTPGGYELRLFANNGYTRLATSNPFTVSAATTLTASPTTVAAGGSVTATWSAIASPSPTDWIGLYTPGAGDMAYVTWIYVSCSQAPGAATAAGSCPFAIPGGLTPGTYQLRLYASNGYTRLATSNAFTVTAAGGGGASLGVTPTTVPRGGSVTVTWSGIPSPTPRDWIGLYASDAADTAVVARIYVSCSQVPGAAAAAGACKFLISPGATPGLYQLRLFSNDTFTRLAVSNALTVN